MDLSRKELFSSIIVDVNDRSKWETRQQTWYDMRHYGLRRKNKPWSSAADLHYPLSDSTINRIKPYYFQQIYASELIAAFVPWRDQAAALTQSAAMWFDYKIRQRTNLETESLTLIDHFLMSGLSLMKTYWEPEKQKICYDAIHPINAIVPSYTRNWEECTRVVHVMEIGVDAYRMRENYKQGEEFIKSISGKGSDNYRNTNYNQNVRTREGITTTSDANSIVVWEVHQKVRNNQTPDSILISTFSPVRPEEDVRAEYEQPYEHGQLCFIPFVNEIKDKGFYSSRGIPEMIAPFEASLCKMWNEKHDCMTIYNRPILQNSGDDIPNPTNLRWNPGQILPKGVTPVMMPSPPISFDQEMVQQRMVAEQLLGVPDYGMGQNQNTRDSRTATEISALAGQASQGVDMRARIFRLSLGALWRMSWSLLKQYDAQSLLYFHQDKQGAITPEALQNDYVISPSGSADGINKPLLMQKAVQRKQMFANDPFINQAELDKSILEIDDPKLISRLVIDPNQRKQDQMEEAGTECLLMLNGLPVTVSPPDDDVTHLQTHLGYIDSAQQRGQQMNQQQVAPFMQHIQQHLQKLSATNPQAAKQFEAAIAERMKHAQNAQAKKQAAVQQQQPDVQQQ
jgi:hypothetical protein